MHVTDAERKVLEVLWAEGSATAAQVAEALGSQGWHRKTVNTLLARLVEKGAVDADRNRPKRYTPTLAREAFAAEQLGELSRGLFGGKVAPLVATLVDAEKLDPEDAAELRALIDRLESEGKP